MPKVTAKDILKPGCKLEARVIDRNDLEVKKLLERTEKAQAETRNLQKWTQQNYDNLRRVITI